MGSQTIFNPYNFFVIPLVWRNNSLETVLHRCEQFSIVRRKFANMRNCRPMHRLGEKTVSKVLLFQPNTAKNNLTWFASSLWVVFLYVDFVSHNFYYYFSIIKQNMEGAKHIFIYTNHSEKRLYVFIYKVQWLNYI